jgi:transketolase C-terminal domain/subunit
MVIIVHQKGFMVLNVHILNQNVTFHRAVTIYTKDMDFVVTSISCFDYLRAYKHIFVYINRNELHLKAVRHSSNYSYHSEFLEIAGKTVVLLLDLCSLTAE